jgi:hypothetical protein
MKSIKGSMFITINSGEQDTFGIASQILGLKAEKLTAQLTNVMPVKLIKVETISFIPNGDVSTKWLATGLLKKIDMSRQ